MPAAQAALAQPVGELAQPVGALAQSAGARAPLVGVLVLPAVCRAVDQSVGWSAALQPSPDGPEPQAACPAVPADPPPSSYMKCSVTTAMTQRLPSSGTAANTSVSYLHIPCGAQSKTDGMLHVDCSRC